MSNILKNTTKFAIGTCITLSAVAIAASVVACSDIVKGVTDGFIGTKNAVQEEMDTLNTDVATSEENISDEVVISHADFEN